MKRNYFIYLLMMAVIFFASCTKEEHNNIIIGSAMNSKPFAYYDENGIYTGFDVELFTAIAANQKISFTFLPDDFPKTYQKLLNGEVDGMMATLSIIDSRRGVIDFSDSYLQNAITLGVSTDNTDIANYNDLNGKRIIAQESTTCEYFALSIQEQYGFILTLCSSIDEAYNAVNSGEQDGILHDYLSMRYRANLDNKIKIIGEPQDQENYIYGFGVKKGTNAALIRKFNAGLEELKKNGIYQQLYNKYFGN